MREDRTGVTEVECRAGEAGAGRSHIRNIESIYVLLISCWSHLDLKIFDNSLSFYTHFAL